MASSMIHICIANELNKKIKRNSKKLLLGTIAPDIAKQVGRSRASTHFYEEKTGEKYPNLALFLKKYESFLFDDFVMGYYIHLYTDYLWSKYFASDFLKENTVMTIDGESLELTSEDLKRLLYQDYTNLNIQLIDKYGLDLSLFYEDLPELDPIIQEISYEELPIIVDKVGIIIENSKVKKSYLFCVKDIQQFITMCVELIGSEICF